MADLKKLQEMAKNGEISKELMKDEEFKGELKKALKEELGVEVTDGEIPEILKELEKNLDGEKGDNQVLSEENLEGVSGGIARSKLIKGVAMYLGAFIGSGAGKAVGKQAYGKYNKEYAEAKERMEEALKGVSFFDKPAKMQEYLKNPENSADAEILEKYSLSATAAESGATLAGAGAGITVGSWFGNYLCKKFNIK